MENRANTLERTDKASYNGSRKQTGESPDEEERMRVSCLVVDHDDTVVNSTATVHYPCFVEYVREYFPHYHCTLEEYFLKNFDPGVVPFFRDEVGMSKEQMAHEEIWWNA